MKLKLEINVCAFLDDLPFYIKGLTKNEICLEIDDPFVSKFLDKIKSQNITVIANGDEDVKQYRKLYSQAKIESNGLVNYLSCLYVKII